MKTNSPHAVLIATVGAEPQVVTLVLDALLLQSYPVVEVVLIYTSSPNILSGVHKLENEIKSNRYHDIKPTRILLSEENNILDDFRVVNDVHSMLKTIYKVIREYKQKGFRIHLSVTGGRKVMAVMAMVAAQILFGPEDRVWYLITEGWRPGSSQEMHRSDNSSHTLLEVPVIRWEESYLLLGMAEFATPMELIHWQENLLKNKKMRRRREFIERWLSKAERQVVLLACQGWDNASIAERLHKQERTVANQLTSVYGKLYEWLEFPEVRVDRSLMIAELAPYFALKTERSGGSS